MKTNLLVATYLAKRFEPDWKAAIRLQLRVNTQYPYGLWQQGNKAKRRIASLKT